MTEANTETPDGLELVRDMIEGRRRATMGETLSFRVIEAERGRVVFEGHPGEGVLNPFGSVHGGYAATVLDSACGIAVQSALGPGRGHTTLELKTSYLRPMTADSGPVRAEGRVIQAGRRVAFSEATLHDRDGRLCATATATLLVFDTAPPAATSGD